MVIENAIVSKCSSLDERKPGVLIVDDEPAIRYVLGMGMRIEGFRVWLAADGKAALKTYWRHRESIDAVLLDVRMPHMDGPQTLEKLRELTSRIHCCFISGDLGGYTEQNLLQRGAAAVFRKPLLIPDVARKLLELMNDTRLNPSFREARLRQTRIGPTPSGVSVQINSFQPPFSRTRPVPQMPMAELQST